MTPQEKARQLRPLLVKASASLSDKDALEAVELFDAWTLDTFYERGVRLRYGGKLYRVEQAHTSQADWLPDITPALYSEVEKPGQGDTPDNPIPYSGNLELYEGKFYAQDGVTYICIRSTGTPVYHPLAQLVGLYVEVWTG